MPISLCEASRNVSTILKSNQPSNRCGWHFFAYSLRSYLKSSTLAPGWNRRLGQEACWETEAILDTTASSRPTYARTGRLVSRKQQQQQNPKILRAHQRLTWNRYNQRNVLDKIQTPSLRQALSLLLRANVPCPLGFESLVLCFTRHHAPHTHAHERNCSMVLYVLYFFLSQLNEWGWYHKLPSYLASLNKS